MLSINGIFLNVTATDVIDLSLPRIRIVDSTIWWWRTFFHVFLRKYNYSLGEFRRKKKNNTHAHTKHVVEYGSNSFYALSIEAYHSLYARERKNNVYSTQLPDSRSRKKCTKFSLRIVSRMKKSLLRERYTQQKKQQTRKHTHTSCGTTWTLSHQVSASIEIVCTVHIKCVLQTTSSI